MSSYAATNLTDDEDSYQENLSSGVVDESIVESSGLDSEENSNIGNDSNSLSSETKKHRRSSETKNHRLRKKSNKEVEESDSDSSEEDNAHTSFTKTRNSSSRILTSSFSSQPSPEKSSKHSNLEKRTESIMTTKSSFLKARSPENSDSDDNIGVKMKTKKNIIASDSETDSDNIESVNESGRTKENSESIEIISTDEEVEKITKNLNNSRISNEFNFGKEGNIVNSTLLDIESQATPKSGSKRLFNKSSDTPRILKQLKESSTPRTPTSSKTIQQDDPLLTPRNSSAIIPSRSPSPSSSLEVLSDDGEDIIDVSSGDTSPPTPAPLPQRQKKVVKQSTLDYVVVKKSVISEAVGEKVDSPKTIEVSPKELAQQRDKIRKIEVDLHKANNLLRTVNLSSLPDKGKLIRDRNAAIEQMLLQEVKKLSKMVVTKEDPPEDRKSDALKKGPASWEQIEAAAGAVLPKTFGKRAMNTYNAQKALTMDRLQQLHGSLENCPKENYVEKDPEGLKVELMPHQKRALAWLMWREKQKPSGGILADDMGLGKTLTMISLMLRSLEIERDENEESDTENQQQKSSPKFKGGTLVVCPASLLNQWSGELERRTRRGLASFEIYHGPKRETKPKTLCQYDMVITTYAIVMNECEKNGAIFRVKWRRIVVDEAHQIRNYKSQTSEAVCRLAAKSRWALTGTPVHNKELDMYALLKFLRCSPFDDLQVWKRWVGDKSTGGQERLHTVISSLMLRRTKVELMEKGALKCMPERKWELIPVTLDKNEMDVYQKILLFSRTLFAQFLHQRAEKNQDQLDLRYSNLNGQPNGPNQEYFKMRDKLLRLHNVRDIKQHEILVLLLRLRQICCHPSLIINMLHEDMEDLDEHANPEEMDILDQLNKMALDDDKYDEGSSNTGQKSSHNDNEAPALSQAAKSLLNPAHPVFAKERASSKIKTVLEVLKEKVVNTEDKAIIVSQWPSFLRLIACQLEKKNITFDQLDGSIPVNKRMIMVDKFNNPQDKMKILLLSLTAGGVGLNLVGANHLFLLDLHWNPQLENQAQDRIYRVGQSKPVFVYKFMATDTIEKRILDLQEKKLDIANSMLTGSKQVIGSKLSLQDLKMLFDM